MLKYAMLQNKDRQMVYRKDSASFDCQKQIFCDCNHLKMFLWFFLEKS